MSICNKLAIKKLTQFYIPPVQDIVVSRLKKAHDEHSHVEVLKAFHWMDLNLGVSMHLSEVFMTMNKLTKCLYGRNRSCEGTRGRRSVAKGH